jgi:hypothetical protein
MPHQTAPEPATPKPAAPRRRRRRAQLRPGGPARPNVVQRLFNRYPRSFAAVCAVLLGCTTALFTIHLAQAGRTVGSWYGVAVAGGLLFPVALTVALILIWRVTRKSGVLIFGILGLGVLWFGCFIYAGPAVYNHGLPLEVITSPVQAAALALTAMGTATVTVLTGLIIFRPREAGSRGWRGPAPAGPLPGLITGLAGPRKNGWSVTWVGAGRVPAPVHAPSLSLAATVAAGAVASLFAHGTTGAATEFQLAIYPWPYHGGPVFDITGAPGGFTARNGATSVPGATLEDLLTAAQRMPAGHGAMFRWTRPVSALPPPG